jgi:hypothetical protein
MDSVLNEIRKQGLDSASLNFGDHSFKPNYLEWVEQLNEGTFLKHVDFDKWWFFWKRYMELSFTESNNFLSYGGKDYGRGEGYDSLQEEWLHKLMASQVDVYLQHKPEILEAGRQETLLISPKFEKYAGWSVEDHYKEAFPEVEWTSVGLRGPSVAAQGLEDCCRFGHGPYGGLINPLIDPNQTLKWVSMITFVIIANPIVPTDKQLATPLGFRKTSVPLDFLLKGDELDEDTYHLYVHEVRDESPELGLDVFRSYIGITGRDWLLRFKEHQREAYKDSYYRVHKAMKISPNINSTLLATGLSYREVNELEEKLVEEHSLFPKGLNMIPGGFAGARYLNSRGHKTRKKHTSESNPDFINKDVRECKARGERSVFDPPVWAYDDDLMSRIVLSRPDTFSKGDLANIRYLDNYLETLDYDFNQRREYISKEMKLVTDNEQRRLRSLLTGKTYSRIT